MNTNSEIALLLLALCGFIYSLGRPSDAPTLTQVLKFLLGTSIYKWFPQAVVDPEAKPNDAESEQVLATLPVKAKVVVKESGVIQVAAAEHHTPAVAQAMEPVEPEDLSIEAQQHFTVIEAAIAAGSAASSAVLVAATKAEHFPSEPYSADDYEVVEHEDFRLDSPVESIH